MFYFNTFCLYFLLLIKSTNAAAKAVINIIYLGLCSCIRMVLRTKTDYTNSTTSTLLGTNSMLAKLTPLASNLKFSLPSLTVPSKDATGLLPVGTILLVISRLLKNTTSWLSGVQWRSFSFGFYYIQGVIFLLFIDACLTDDEPLWEPIE